MKPKIYLITALWLLLFANANSQTTDERPNLILILADDLGYADLSLNKSKQIKTPNIDQLAKSGIYCSQAYVSSPVCSPSRAGIMTGVNQVEFGFDNNISENQKGFDPKFKGLPTTQKIIPEFLKSYGYVNGLIGKWHLGEETQFSPLNRGFDEFWGFTVGGHDYFFADTTLKGYKGAILCNYKKTTPITYITDDIGNECIDFIRRHKKEPFFLYASFNAPHAPMQATKEDLELYKHIKDENRRTYAAMVHRLDINVGRMVAELEKQQISKKTLIVFLSDNGGPVDQNASCNAPYNGQKGILLEGGIHVPFIVSWPGKIKAGDSYDKIISALDIAPTFVELAANKKITDSINFTGVNIVPYLNGKVKTEPHDKLMWRFTISAAIREGDWKLVRLPNSTPKLYYLKSDISEQKDVFLENIELGKSLLKKLGNWDVELPHPLFLEGAEWKRKQLDLYDKKYSLTQPE